MTPGAVVLAAWLAGPAGFVPREPWGPWHDAWPPVGDVAATAPARPVRSGVLEAAYRWWRDVGTLRDGAVCQFYPTCSGFAVLSLRARGPVVAALLTWDRLEREHRHLDRLDYYPRVVPHETPRFYDPAPAPRPRRGSRRGR